MSVQINAAAVNPEIQYQKQQVIFAGEKIVDRFIYNFGNARIDRIVTAELFLLAQFDQF